MRRREEELRRRAEESHAHVEEHLVLQEEEELMGKLPGGQVDRILSSSNDLQVIFKPFIFHRIIDHAPVCHVLDVRTPSGQVLQLPGSATHEEVKAAYRSLEIISSGLEYLL